MEASIRTRAQMMCNICGKSFDNRKSRLRHGSYCRRALAQNRVRSRKKACTVCVKAKTRCDLAYPCSHCAAKGLTCGYEPPIVSSSTLSTHGVTLDPNIDLLSDLEASSMQLIWKRTDAAIPLQDSAVSGVHLDTAGHLNRGTWSLGPVNTPLASMEALGGRHSTDLSFLGSAEYSELMPIHSDTFESGFHPAFLDGTSATQLESSSTSSLSALDLDQIILKVPKAFSKRSISSQHAPLNRNFVLCTLKSYPYRMLRKTDRPPFIHSYYGYAFANTSTDHKSGQNPLEICAIIVQMCSRKNRGNVVFIWRAIKLEQERILAECSQYTDRETIAALQAIAIYYLLRIAEDNEDATNFDVPLINTLVSLIGKVRGLIMRYDNPSQSSIPTWEGWILAESLRRTIIVIFLIDLLFDTASVLQAQGHICDGSLLAGLALPCSRDLWRASSRAEWEMEFAAQRERTGGREQLTYVDLIKFQFKAEGSLDVWLSQIDDFGTLVMSAASIQHWSGI